MAEIYALSDPMTGLVRYIGKARDSEKRYKGHMSETRRNTPLYCWIGSLRTKGLAPSLSVLCVCDDSLWAETEKKYIKEYRAMGQGLLNVAEGGDQPFCSRETRAINGKKTSVLRISTPLKARVYKLKHIMGQLLRTGHVSENAKNKLRYAALKSPHLFGLWANI